jgi:hypothetical protein
VPAAVAADARDAPAPVTAEVDPTDWQPPAPTAAAEEAPLVVSNHVKGKTWHEHVVAVLRECFGDERVQDERDKRVNDTHLDAHSGDVLLRAPGPDGSDVWILIENKNANIECRWKHIEQVRRDADSLIDGGQRVDCAVVMYPDHHLTDRYRANPVEGGHDAAGFRTPLSRVLICSPTTFAHAILRLCNDMRERALAADGAVSAKINTALFVQMANGVVLAQTPGIGAWFEQARQTELKRKHFEDMANIGFEVHSSKGLDAKEGWVAAGLDPELAELVVKDTTTAADSLRAFERVSEVITALV